MGNKKKKYKFMNSIFWVSFTIIFLFALWGAVAPQILASQAEVIYGFIANTFGWFYLSFVLFIIIFNFYLAFSKYGRIKLGGENTKPKYPLFTWIAMLFSTGFGVSIVFWGVAEPMTHFGTPPPFDPSIEAGTAEAAREAMWNAFFNNGIHQWASFTFVGLALSYFIYRQDERSLISDTMNPVIGDKGKKPLRNTIDIIAVIATVMGVATTLGLSVLQINGGLGYVFNVPSGTTTQLIIVGAMFVFFMVSTISGLDKGIKYLSNANLGLALVLMVAVLFIGPTGFILDTITMGVGDYLQNFFQASLRLDQYTQGTWVQDWPVYYWAWTIAWAPFVGMFVARISKGRTVREFVLGVMVAPPAIGLIWIGIFGGTAINFDLFHGTDIAGAVAQDETTALFAMLENVPLGTILSVLSIGLLFTFLVTSADSATFVLGMMTSNGDTNPSVVVKVVWGSLIASLAIILIISAGLEGLQTASLIGALPFSIVLFVAAISLLKSIREDYKDARRKAEKQAEEKRHQRVIDHIEENYEFNNDDNK
ncbi:glycine/betaine ABC transporter permease [Thalassobacillus devorans]|uniref:Glycine/betaine ABC transporter permease n=1 Tax=Thalassobacillus devorans TaxID=279813 RepID=A0ABQ1PK07_9BACI|nr:BCCT family transporter [Thalassobacillus devorans]NIK30125.1 choline/carnitine/betaine transport [Thalassobacillus devorans]GGC98525.1 glycine/betaine ABC transporter permease [Thalassobacillus devorans]